MMLKLPGLTLARLQTNIIQESSSQFCKRLTEKTLQQIWTLQMVLSEHSQAILRTHNYI